jgi:hypothetical protein
MKPKLKRPTIMTKPAQAKTNNNKTQVPPHQKLMTPEEYLHYLVSRV